MITLKPCPKKYKLDQDKAVTPEETVSVIRKKLAALEVDILSEVKQIDTGRLGIPVFLSIAGSRARSFMPVRKQMGKGVTPAQAEASAVMELMERYGFFTFWQNAPGVFRGTWSEAKAKFGSQLLPIQSIIESVYDLGTPAQAEKAMELIRWSFFPVLELGSGRTVYAPLDWFKKLGEFNGSSAGNNDVESILQGCCELVERHVCCLAEEEKSPLPTINQESINDPVLRDLLKRFTDNGIKVILKDFSSGMPVPTVAALAYDPATFPELSEIVFTAGTATSPEKAAMRALTEVAQLGGDFMTGACYEASGLPKYLRLEDIVWLEAGPVVNLENLPELKSEDMLIELNTLCRELGNMGYSVYSIATTNQETGIPSHYSFIPGFRFRERDKSASVGLFIGRILAEETPDDEAESGLVQLEKIYPGAHYLPFFKGLLAMRLGEIEKAKLLFAQAETVQPNNDSLGLAVFYHAYSMTLEDKWHSALPLLNRATQYCPEMKEYFNLRGVCNYKLHNYAAAAEDFEYIIKYLDKGSVMDLANLGVCNKFLGKNKEAVHYLIAALEIEPALEFAKNHLDELLAELSAAESNKTDAKN